MKLSTVVPTYLAKYVKLTHMYKSLLSNLIGDIL